jgi:Flp pilus assembly protein TadD
MRSLLIRYAALIALVAGIAGCSASQARLELEGEAAKAWPPAKVKRSAVEYGQHYYRVGAYGLAEAKFRAAVENDPKNAEAWLGLAASYDRLRRFDHADRAYRAVIKLVGYTPTVLNNLGYHYYLQGNRTSAVQTLERAHRADPGNEYINNNLDLARGKAPAAKSGKAASEG